MKKLVRRFPFLRYSLVPTALVFVYNVLVYFGSKLLNANFVHHSLALPLDGMIPFCTAMIGVYLLAYVQWGIGYLAAGYESRALLSEAVFANFAAKTICFVCFLVYPTTIARPEVVGDGFFDLITRLIFSADTPVNLFPSIHCLESWLCVRMALKSRKMPRCYLPLTILMTILVMASTLLLKQHYFADILGGVAVTELGLLLSRLLHGERLLDAIESALRGTRKNKERQTSDESTKSECAGVSPRSGDAE